MAPLVFYAPIAALALAGIFATLGAIHGKLEEKCESRCSKIKNDAGLKHSGSKWTMDEILDIHEISWKIQEIRNSTDKEILRVVWVLFALLGMSLAGLAISIVQTSMIVPFFEELVTYIDVLISGFIVVFIPILYRLIKLALYKP